MTINLKKGAVIGGYTVKEKTRIQNGKVVYGDTETIKHIRDDEIRTAGCCVGMLDKNGKVNLESYIPGCLSGRAMTEKRITDITVGELMDIIANQVRETILQVQAEGEKAKDTPAKKVYGINGLADLFGCSTRTASRIKQSGKIDEAITQIGHTIVVDSEMALELLRRRK